MTKLNNFLIAIIAAIFFACVQSYTPVPQGFPNRWDGDRYYKSECELVQRPPTWLDGYFFCQLSASYGDQSSPAGAHVDHMFDAIGGMAVFDVSPDKATFTGAYYPSRSYKIWNFYDRDFAQSSVAWRPAFADLNTTQHKLWEKILPDFDAPTPNVDFWKIRDHIIAGTEFYQVGFTFDMDTFDHFRFYPFKEASPIMLGQPLFPIHMPIHERMDTDTGLLWATVSALDISKRPPSLHQVVFTVNEDGVRTVEGIYDYSQWDPSKCQTKDGFYDYDPARDFFPRNMHSFSSTKNYIILPLSSIVFNPCILLKGPRAADITFGQFYRFNQQTEVKFLIFDKRSKKFIKTIKYSDKPLFVSHQFNSYEQSDNKLIADMIGYSNDVYESLSVKTVTQIDKLGVMFGHAYRFTIDLEQESIDTRSILPQDPSNIEFPQFNHNFEGKKYQYGYAITNVYYAGNSILKIDMNEPSGKNNLEFKPREQDEIALLEPYFVPRPGSNQEDDGVIVSRGFDITINKTRVYIIDAKNMKKVGEVLAPIDTPFGFHERFYLKESFKTKLNNNMKTEL